MPVGAELLEVGPQVGDPGLLGQLALGGVEEVLVGRTKPPGSAEPALEGLDAPRHQQHLTAASSLDGQDHEVDGDGDSEVGGPWPTV